MKRMLLVLALALATFGARTALGGANETPGQNYKPHAFGYFSANSWEFGPTDVGIFQGIVVASQHYAQGAAYNDAASDLGTGGAGLWNFFTFCSDKKHDVMLVTSHGYATPSTAIECYPNTAAGLAARNASYDYWVGIFGAAKLEKQTIAGSGHHLCVTQAFYTAYFQTPQAFAWWATCWSSGLAMTGAVEARAFLGYDNVVWSSKCYCDERTILRKMDGQSGQALRPLAAAFAGVNGICPPGGARLVLQGKGNTVLSPSVIDFKPVGIVCEPTPGLVKFDTTMDITVPPASVVVAFGGGVLVGHVWAGDDQINFTVVPIVPCPTILYDVIESKAISKADRARLDGNTNPAVNALGPNQDDFVWVTTCPCWPWYPIDVPDLTIVPDPVAGIPIDVLTPIMNHQPITASVTAWLDIPGLVPPMSQNFTINPQSHVLGVWQVQIPPSVPPGSIFQAVIRVEGAGDPVVFQKQVVIHGPVKADWGSLFTLRSGQSNTLEVRLSNNSTTPVAGGASLVCDAGWTVTPPLQPLMLDPGQSVDLSFECDVPPSAPPNMQAEFHVDLDAGGVYQAPLRAATVGLPVLIQRRTPIDFCPGNTQATIPIELVSLSLVSVMPISVNATSTHGWNVEITIPPVLPPNQPVTGTLVMPIPADPSLLGQSGAIAITIVDQDGNRAEASVPYTVESAIEVTTPALELLTGWGSPHATPTTMVLRNRADVPVSGIAMVQASGIGVSPGVTNFNLPPNTSRTVNMMVTVPVDLPADSYPMGVAVQSQTGIGNSTQSIEHVVTTPVVVSMVARAIGVDAGTTVQLEAQVENLRTDRSFDGQILFTDTKGWITGGAGQTYHLAPGTRESFFVTLDVPEILMRAETDTDLVVVDVTMTYDSGTAAVTEAQLTLVASGTTTGTPDPLTVLESGLQAAAPNPFAAHTEVRFGLAAPGLVDLAVYDTSGRRVRSLARGPMEAGTHQRVFDGRAEDGRELPAGVYYVRLTTPDSTVTRKLVRMD